jgi:porin
MSSQNYYQFRRTVLSTVAALSLSQSGFSAQAQSVDDTSILFSGEIAVSNPASNAGFGGPKSVGRQLEEDAARRVTTSRNPDIDAFFQPAEDSLAQLNEKHGLKLGFDYQATWQHASHSLYGDTQASSGQARMIGKWELIGRGTENHGSISFIVENRHRLWNDLVPSELANEIGYLGVTGTTYSHSGSHLSVLYWEQALFEGRAGFVAGRIDPTDFTDILGYANPRGTFTNFSSLLNTSVVAPDPGFGVGAGLFITDQIYALGIITDANGSLTDVEWFPGGHEYYRYGEIGWTPSREERYSTNVHVGFWNVDERVEAGVSEGHGFVTSAIVTIDEVFAPFVRAGWSSGTAPLANQHFSAGFTWLFPQYGDMFGFSAALDKPSSPGLRDQTTLEAFYRYELSDNVAITADAQLLINPSLNPTRDQIAVFGLNLRFNM